MEQKVYDFHEELAYSHEDEHVFDRFYKCLFPNLDDVHRYTDLKTQKRGIDVMLVIHENPYYTEDKSRNYVRMIYVDEKKDKGDRDTIFLEEYSDTEYGKMGWLFTAECDAIAYCIWPRKEFYWLPLRELRKAYFANYDEWHTQSKTWKIQNKGWYATGIGIRTEEIVAKVKGASVTVL